MQIMQSDVSTKRVTLVSCPALPCPALAASSHASYLDQIGSSAALDVHIHGCIASFPALQMYLCCDQHSIAVQLNVDGVVYMGVHILVMSRAWPVDNSCQQHAST